MLQSSTIPPHFKFSLAQFNEKDGNPSSHVKQKQNLQRIKNIEQTQKIASSLINPKTKIINPVYGKKEQLEKLRQQTRKSSESFSLQNSSPSNPFNSDLEILSWQEFLSLQASPLSSPFNSIDSPSLKISPLLNALNIVKNPIYGKQKGLERRRNKTIEEKTDLTPLLLDAENLVESTSKDKSLIFFSYKNLSPIWLQYLHILAESKIEDLLTTSIKEIIRQRSVYQEADQKKTHTMSSSSLMYPLSPEFSEKLEDVLNKNYNDIILCKSSCSVDHFFYKMKNSILEKGALQDIQEMLQNLTDQSNNFRKLHMLIFIPTGRLAWIARSKKLNFMKNKTLTHLDKRWGAYSKVDLNKLKTKSIFGIILFFLFYLFDEIVFFQKFAERKGEILPHYESIIKKLLKIPSFFAIYEKNSVINRSIYHFWIKFLLIDSYRKYQHLKACLQNRKESIDTIIDSLAQLQKNFQVKIQEFLYQIGSSYHERNSSPILRGSHLLKVFPTSSSLTTNFDALNEKAKKRVLEGAWQKVPQTEKNRYFELIEMVEISVIAEKEELKIISKIAKDPTQVFGYTGFSIKTCAKILKDTYTYLKRQKNLMDILRKSYSFFRGKKEIVEIIPALNRAKERLKIKGKTMTLKHIFNPNLFDIPGKKAFSDLNFKKARRHIEQEKIYLEAKEKYEHHEFLDCLTTIFKLSVTRGEEKIIEGILTMLKDLMLRSVRLLARDEFFMLTEERKNRLNSRIKEACQSQDWTEIDQLLLFIASKLKSKGKGYELEELKRINVHSRTHTFNVSKKKLNEGSKHFNSL